MLPLLLNRYLLDQTLLQVGLGYRILLFILLVPVWAFPQYSNHWIKSGQTYFRIPVARQGVYRLTHAHLLAAGVPLNTIDPRQLQLFHRGVEQSIHVQGQADAVFDASDYLEFFGKVNDGTLDKELYKPVTNQPHSYYNLYSDTTAYFLTWQTTGVLGKRVENFSEVNVLGLPVESDHNETRRLINFNEYSTGFRESDVLQYTHFDEGEGWTGTALRQGQSIDYTLDQISNTVTSGGIPTLELLLVGRDNIPHTVQIYVGPTTGSLRLLDAYSFNAFEKSLLTYPLNWSDIGVDGKLVVRLMVPPEANNRFQVSASYLSITFPQNFNCNGVTEKYFQLRTNVVAPNKSYVELVNAPINLRIWDISDPTAIKSIGAVVDGTTLKAIVPQTQTSRTLWVFNSVITPTIKQVSFRSINPATAEYVVISNKVLMQPALGYPDPVKAYAGYRATAAGGGYDTLVVEINQLYNQFNYGETSARAIYEFMRYLVEEGSPKYLFLIGKGRDVNSGFHRIINPPANVLKDLVPTAGIPASDMVFTVGLGTTEYEPAVPTGRLTASTAAQVAGYLNKIRETEIGQVQDWHKKGLHLSGGILPAELVAFRNFLDGYESIASGPYYGGQFSTIAKQDPNPVELINISDQVNAGVNLITFFGHSSPSTIDIDIGFVSDPTMGYNNPGKYPVFLINGCNAGNFFSGSTSFGEDWMLTSNKGARNFIAHSSYGLVNSLWYYSNLFYSIGLADSTFLKKGIGDLQKEVGRRYMHSASENVSNITQVQQMVLLGDPAVRLFNYPKPDYQLLEAGLSVVSFDSKPVTAASDSFAVQVIVKNLAMATLTPLKIKVKRKLTTGVELVYDSVFAAVANTDTVLLIMHKLAGSGGANEFTVTLDPDHEIEELSEENNEVMRTVFIPSNTTLNLFPFNYAIVNQQQVNLTWQSTDLLSETREFEIEVDTAHSFSSQYLIARTVSGKVLAKLSLSVLPSDSTVYYWRTRFKNPQAGESTDWVTSSFIYIQGSPEGWAQVNSIQISPNTFSNLIPPNGAVPFSFTESQTKVDIETFGSTNPLPYTDASVRIDGSEYNLSTQGQPCRNHTLNLLAFKKTSVVPYAALPFNFQDPRTCGREPQIINSFLLSELETGLGDDLIAWIDAVETSDSVVLFSIGNAGYTSWSTSVKTKLGELGIQSATINALQNGEPVIIWGRKGAVPGTAKVIKAELAPLTDQLISSNETITGRNTSGSMKSVIIGPAKSWAEFVSDIPTVEGQDQFLFSIYGVRTNGTELLLGSTTSQYDLSNVSPQDFPYLKIEFSTTDEINLTPAQWNKWFVIYESAAEGMLIWDGDENHVSIDEGDDWNTRFGFVNISNREFTDSLQVNLEVLTRTSQTSDRQQFRIQAPVPGDTTFFLVSTASSGKAGLNDVSVMANPKLLPEPYYENNFIALPEFLTVIPDQTAPVLEVTFDGRLLRNGDYVSSQPLIHFRLHDENKFFFKQDTAGVTLLLKYPCVNEPCSFDRITLNSPQVQIIPATTENDFQIYYSPALEAGEYELSVEMPDASGNFSAQPYQISFQVNTENTFQYLGHYPNPSSTDFYFGFLVTGTLPDDFTLEVVSVQGQRIRKFDSEDVAGFVIGRNELRWDGKDTSGNYVPTGLYVFKLDMYVNGLLKEVQGKLIVNR